MEKKLQEILESYLLDYRKLFPELLGSNLAMVLKLHLHQKNDIEDFIKIFKKSFDKVIDW